MKTGPAAALALATLAACSSSDPTQESPAPAEVTFPKGFLWGSATAAFQVESGSVHTDWWHWAKQPGKIQGGAHPDVGGADALAHVDDDIKALKDSGQNAYRFSIEWSRVYPTRESFDQNTPDPAALAAYDGLLDKLRAASLVPVVTLQHFALPEWLTDVARWSAPYGWERPEIVDLFAEWARRAGARWGKDVDYWVTINEPVNVVLGGYVAGLFPPGALLNVDRGLQVVRAEARAHAKAFEALHAADTVDADGDGKASLVSMAFHMRTFHPKDASDDDDKAAAERTRRLWNQWLLDALVKGDVDDDFDGTLTGPKDRKGDATLAGHLDWIGVNYYSDTIIAAGGGIKVPVINAVVLQDDLPTGRPRTDFGWDIYPEGFRTVLNEAKAYGLPLMVTENGLADDGDKNRARFLAEHLYQMGRAIQDGAKIIGYMHWSLVDNFEWASGYCPKFGLYRVNADGSRTARPSVQSYRAIIESGKVTRAAIDALPAYAPPPQRCR